MIYLNIFTNKLQGDKGKSEKQGENKNCCALILTAIICSLPHLNLIMGYFANSRPEIQDMVPASAQTVLDVGCGEGLFGAGLKQKHNSIVWGIEPDPHAAAIAQNNLDKVFPALFENALPLIGEQKFDCICFNDVLEHMTDPWKCLRNSKALLNKDAVVIASLPNVLYYHTFFGILLSKDWRYEPSGIMDKTHLRWFTKKSLHRMFEECGYEVLSVAGLTPAKTIKMGLLSLLSFGYFSEMKYPQMVLIAKQRV